MNWFKNFISFVKNKNRATHFRFSDILLSFIFAVLIFIPATIGIGLAFSFSLEKILVIAFLPSWGFSFLMVFQSFYNSLKIEFAPEFQKNYLLITQAINDDKVFFKSLDYEKNQHENKIKSYELVLDCGSDIVCMFLKDGIRQCHKINKETGEETTNSPSILYYQKIFEDEFIKLQNKQNFQNTNHVLKQEAKNFFTDVSDVFSSNKPNSISKKTSSTNAT